MLLLSLLHLCDPKEDLYVKGQVNLLRAVFTF